MHPPAPRCFQCQNDSFLWKELAGTGTIYSYTVVHHGLRPALREAVPYVSAVIDIDGTQGAGARMILNLIDVDPAMVRIGDKVRVIFDRVSEAFPLPRAIPA